MKPERMLKCSMVAPKTMLSTVVDALYELELYHITPHLRGMYQLEIGEPLADAELLSSLVLKVRALRTMFPEVRAQPCTEIKKSAFPSFQRKIVKTHETAQKLQQEQLRLQAEKESLRSQLVALTLLRKLKINFFQLQQSSRLCFFLGTLSKTEGLTEALQQISDDSSLALNTKQFLFVGRKEHQDAFTRTLQGYGYTPFSLPAQQNAPHNTLHNVQQKFDTKHCREAYQHVQKEEAGLQEKHLQLRQTVSEVIGKEVLLQEEIRKQELPLRFGVTGRTFVASGWIPERDQEKVQHTLEEVTNKKIAITFAKPSHQDQPPVKLQHQKIITPFEFLLRLYNLPKYHEIDPTSFLFFTFPLFFGMMLGDVGYGLVLIGSFWYLQKKLQKKFPAARQLLDVLLFAAIISVLFGFVFGEVFGFEHISSKTGEALCSNTGICLPQATLISHGQKEVVADFPRLLNRAHSHINVFGFEILTILAIGAIIGFIHLNLGLLFGFFNELHHHGWKHAFLAKMSWMILQAGIIVAVLAGLGMIQGTFTWLGIGFAVLGVIFLGMGEGIQGIVELPSLFSNMLSYMRLGAVGLASVGLAVVVNEKLALPFIEKGGIFVVLGIIIMIIGHGINILLGVIGPFLHSVRLHYVEFFSKFFHGGGLPYQPFGPRGATDE